MSRASKDKMKQTVELVRRGAAILGEPCPTCGGVQVKYHGKTHCTQHEDVAAILSAEEISFDTVAADTRDVLLAKLRRLNAALEKEEDLARQEQLVSLVTKCVDLLQKMPQK